MTHAAYMDLMREAGEDYLAEVKAAGIAYTYAISGSQEPSEWLLDLAFKTYRERERGAYRILSHVTEKAHREWSTS